MREVKRKKKLKTKVAVSSRYCTTNTRPLTPKTEPSVVEIRDL